MTVEEWMIQNVRAELDRRHALGESIERADLQAECGIGAGDLEAVLDRLRADGEAREIAPGRWEKALGAETEATPPARALAVADDEPGAEADDDAAAAGKPDMRVTLDRERVAPAAAAAADPTEFAMSKAMIAALDEQTLGKMVAAGVEAANGAEFVLRVKP